MDTELIKKNLGQRIKAFRTRRNLTQEQFCEIIELEQPNLSNIENGKNLPDISTLFSIIEKGKIEPDFLFGFFNTENTKYSDIDYKIMDLLITLPQASKTYIKNIIENIKMLIKL